MWAIRMLPRPSKRWGCASSEYPTDDGQSWLVNVQPFSGTTFGGGADGSAVNIRIVCGTVAA